MEPRNCPAATLADACASKTAQASMYCVIWREDFSINTKQHFSE
jgi:hypothetical protein